MSKIPKKIQRGWDWWTILWRWVNTLWQPFWLTFLEIVTLQTIESMFGRWIPLITLPATIGLIMFSWYKWSRNHDRPNY